MPGLVRSMLHVHIKPTTALLYSIVLLISFFHFYFEIKNI